MDCNRCTETCQDIILCALWSNSSRHWMLRMHIFQNASEGRIVWQKIMDEESNNKTLVSGASDILDHFQITSISRLVSHEQRNFTLDLFRRLFHEYKTIILWMQYDEWADFKILSLSNSKTIYLQELWYTFEWYQDICHIKLAH